MEAPMTNRTIKHEVKLQKSVIIILAILALGVFANAFAPVFKVGEAQATYVGYDVQKVVQCDPMGVRCKNIFD
jgi:hypothetical protein